LNIDLAGKTAVVTGSSEGIGYAIAHGLAATGATVIINGRDRAKVEAAPARLREAFGDERIRAIAADVGTADGCAALVERLPVVDILVNNAGMFKPIDFFETADDVWDAHWHVNVMSGVRLSGAWLPGMEAAGWGRVIFIASESAFNIPVEMIHYGVSKTADVAVARGLAKRMAGTGVTVNSVLPGPTLSEGVVAMLQASGDGSGKLLEQLGADFVR
jgi:NAD(P)-dependent dehydrogenase (short-subunit alcohol dehydrogenase family)